MSQTYVARRNAERRADAEHAFQDRDTNDDRVPVVEDTARNNLQNAREHCLRRLVGLAALLDLLEPRRARTRWCAQEAG